VPLSLQEAFSSRVERHKRHKLMDIIMLAICDVMSGANGQVIEQFGKNKQECL
jgi:flagellar motor component MotA